MSCAAQIPITLSGDALSLGLLLEGVRQLGLAIQEFGEIVDEKGHACQVDHLLTNSAGDRIGVVRGQDGNLSLVVAEPNRASVKQTVDQVKQAYARLKVLDQAKRNGYQQIKEEKLPDGSIRLVVQKWR
ncbi:MAG: DUF1257 domain-containing protein [Oligoflexia bacterium]|nr:DUF1257 domain-containing protein [Oligoflexia bacterium]